MFAETQSGPFNAQSWQGINEFYPMPLSPALPFDQYDAGGWVVSPRQYNHNVEYHSSRQRPASFGMPSQIASYPPVGYTYHSNSSSDPSRMLQQPYPFPSVNHGEWNQGYAFVPNRHPGQPSPKLVPLEDGRALESSSASRMSHGPPLKPRRSGHALWVGNLHPTTSVIALKNHFSQHMTDDIESVFLISRSTCAFINYRTERACKLALVRFHSSRLNGNNLVCRIRREPGAAGSLPSLSPSITQRSDSNGENSGRDNTPESPTTPVIVGMKNATISSPPTVPVPISVKAPMRFFILKSLTVQDLEASVRKSSWVTQAKNEAALNDAFQEAETVYLIFSANRSGEYFGFARMTSAISAEEMPSPTLPSIEPEGRSPLMAPTYIHTPATASAPKGRIVDDSARGTLFWEACSSNDEESDDKHSEGSSTLSTDGVRDEGMGKTFGVEWLCVTKLPFICTRGLRNPWNANREVKVARDGTEIEPRIGTRLLALFSGQRSPGYSWNV